MGGEVDDCSCTVESVDSFNNKEIFPELNALLEKDYFKFYPVSKALVDITCNQLVFLGKFLEEFIQACDSYHFYRTLRFFNETGYA